ncbi:MAG: hypothetical protein LUG62_03330 [Clostridiales bacterium]|nr:hypothetical protein [Clostridiales bacterium]
MNSKDKISTGVSGKVYDLEALSDDKLGNVSGGTDGEPEAEKENGAPCPKCGNNKWQEIYYSFGSAPWWYQCTGCGYKAYDPEDPSGTPVEAAE